jgi:hypothetical protein
MSAFATARTLPQSGNRLTRGQYGSPVTQLTAVSWDAESNSWQPASENDISQGFAVWAAWDSDWGWMAPWDPEPERNPAAVALGRLGGAAATDAQRAAARENGKRGGRPRHTE